MDFNDTKDEADFRAEARAFLGQHLDPKGEKPLRQRIDGKESVSYTHLTLPTKA